MIDMRKYTQKVRFFIALLLTVGSTILYSCSSNPKNVNGKYSADTTKKTINPNGFIDPPKISLLNEFKNHSDIKASEIRIIKDTLSILSTGWFFYYPFGKFHDMKSLLDVSKFLKFKREYARDKTDGDTIMLYRLYNDKTFIKFIDQPETSRFEIVSGDIKDTSVVLLNGTKIGMDRLAFLNLYFSQKAENELMRIRVVKIISGLDGIWHYYSFKDDKLSDIRFDTDYRVDKN